MKIINPLIAILVLAAVCFSECTKWNPGHYMLVWLEAPQKNYKKIFGTSFKGVQARYFWSDLEPQKDTYDFSHIESDLKLLQENGKRLVVQIMDRRFHNKSSIPVPDYIVNDSKYNGGILESDNGGYIARVWDSTVVNRINALHAALGKRFDAEPHFEAICTEETALGINDKKSIPGFSSAEYLKQLKSRVTETKKAFPNTVVITYVNWLPENDIKELAEYSYQQGAGWGGPDVIPGGSLPAYPYYESYKGKMPFGTAIQTPSLGGKEGTFTMDQLYNMGVDTLNLNYMFWIESDGGTPKFTTDIIPYIDGKNGLTNTECPENIKPCCGDVAAQGFPLRTQSAHPATMQNVTEVIFNLQGRIIGNSFPIKNAPLLRRCIKNP